MAVGEKTDMAGCCGAKSPWCKVGVIRVRLEPWKHGSGTERTMRAGRLADTAERDRGRNPAERDQHMKFEKNAEYHVLRNLGIRTDVKEGGSGFVLSEKEHTHGTVTPEDVLRFTEKVGGAPLFLVERLGVVVRSHANHLNPSTGYNVLKAGGATVTATEAKAGVAPKGGASQRMIEYREAQVERTRAELKKQEGLLAGLYAQRDAVRVAKAEKRADGDSEKLKSLLNPESDARKAARAELERLRAEQAELTASLLPKEPEAKPEPTADDIIDAMLAGEIADTTAPEATAEG